MLIYANYENASQMYLYIAHLYMSTLHSAT